MITWAEKLAHLGMTWEIVPRHFVNMVSVRVNRNPGLVSFGDGETTEAALEDAARGQGIDWNSVARKMTDAEWDKIAHC
jgi:hypothetical protein